MPARLPELISSGHHGSTTSPMTGALMRTWRVTSDW
jgi:hypothetical protein